MKRWKRNLFMKLPLLPIALSVLRVTALKFVPVYYTPLMFKRASQFREKEDFKTVRKWVLCSDTGWVTHPKKRDNK